VLAGRFCAVQPEQTLHNADMDDAYDRTALVATQFYVTLFHDGHNVAGTIDTSDPVRHNGHQAGEFVTELAIHATRLTCCRARGPPHPRPER
jgi:hypothetical protein